MGKRSGCDEQRGQGDEIEHGGSLSLLDVDNFDEASTWLVKENTIERRIGFP